MPLGKVALEKKSWRQLANNIFLSSKTNQFKALSDFLLFVNQGILTKGDGSVRLTS
jgi:hypothetical protein